MSYRQDAEDDARETVEEFREQIQDQLVEEGAASQDLFNDYDGGDEYHHTSHVDKEYSLKEAADLLDDLSDYEETDTGLWEGLQPEQAIGAKAAYTYGGAVLDNWQDMIERINQEYEDELPPEADYDDEDEYREAKEKVAEVAVNRITGKGEQDVDLPEPTSPEPEDEPKPAPKKKGPGFEFFN